MAGYSGTPLPKKLGIGPTSRVLVIGTPPGWDLTQLAAPTLHRRAGAGTYDVILAFCPSRAELVARFAPQLPRLTTAGALWICWPKRAGAAASDLTDNVVREHGLRVGLVDVKVAAVDEIWSGAKFVRRLVDR